MKTLMLGLLVLAVSVFLTLMVLEDNGYILVGYGEWTIEGSLAFFLLMNLVVFALLYLLLRTLAGLWGVPEQLHDWRERRGAKRSRQALNQGLLELSEGNWKRAEKNLIRFAGMSETPLLNYLAAARSAQQQGAHERRDHYLQLAHESMPSANIAVGLTQAELQLDHEQLEQALATLKHLRQIAPRHTHVLKLLAELYRRLNDWQELQLLLPELKKRSVVEKDELATLEFEVFHNLLRTAAKDENLDRLRSTWNAIPKAARATEEMVTVYVNYLINRGENEEVEELIRRSIDRQWSEDLVELYGRVDSRQRGRQLAIAESWLKDRARNPVLLLTLGRLCLRNKLWGKARSYLDASIGAGPLAAAYRELGALLEAMGEREQAMNCFKAGLELNSPAPLAELPTSLKSAGALEEPLAAAPPDIVPPKQLKVTDDKHPLAPRPPRRADRVTV